MRNNLIVLGFVLSTLLLLSNDDGVQQPVTGAPDESGVSCNACHNGGNYNPTIEMKLLDASMQPVTSYVPGTIYNVSLKVIGINSPRSYGFQMVNLADADNADKGLWSGFGNNVKQINLTVKTKPRKYLVQSSPKTDGEFLVKWTAPARNTGKVSFYFSGLATNGNRNTSGDSHVVGKISVEEKSGTSSTQNTFTGSEIKIFPNPATDFINLSGNNISDIVIQNMLGKIIKSSSTLNGAFDVGDLSSGLYFISNVDDDGTKSYLGSFYKL